MLAFLALVITSFFQSPFIALHGNLLANGNFSAGNTGFTSQYPYEPSIAAEGQYTIGKDPCQDSPPSYVWACFGDHTSGHGNMMEADAAPMANVVVWSETIHVQPMTAYHFSYWGAGVDTQGNSSPATLQTSFNGIAQSRIAALPATWTSWVHYHYTWNSGMAHRVTITLIDTNISGPFNDFALDDMSLVTAR